MFPVRVATGFSFFIHPFGTQPDARGVRPRDLAFGDTAIRAQKKAPRRDFGTAPLWGCCHIPPWRKLGTGARLLLDHAALLDAGLLAGESAEIIKLGATHLAVFVDRYGIDEGGERKSVVEGKV